MELRWSPLDHQTSSIQCLRIGWDEVARVQQRVDGHGWLSQLARYRRDWRRHLYVIAPNQRTAMRWAERWTRAKLARVLTESPPLHRTHSGMLSAATPEPLFVS